MCDCHDFVLLGPKRLFNLRYIDSPAEFSMQLVDLGAIRLKATSDRGNSGRVNARCGICAHQSAKPSPKYPALSTRALSPGSTRLAETYICILVSVTAGREEGYERLPGPIQVFQIQR